MEQDESCLRILSFAILLQSCASKKFPHLLGRVTCAHQVVRVSRSAQWYPLLVDLICFAKLAETNMRGC